MEGMPKRKPTRMQGANYSDAGAYFVTICTQNRQKILSTVGAIHESPEITLTKYGEIVRRVINEIPARFGVYIVGHVIMPNHIHLLILLTDEPRLRSIRESTLQNRSVISKIVGYLKMNSSKEINARYGHMTLWQRGFYDHIIRSREDYEEHLLYIHENPMKWAFDELYTDE